MSSRFRALVLCYHAVSDSWSDELAVPARQLESQLTSLLRRGYRPTTAGEVLCGRARSLHVTFDDAYENVRNGLEVLERLRIPATVFACTEYAETGRPLDVPELAAEAAAHPQEMATMSWEELRDLSNRGVEIGSHTVTHPHLTRLSDAELDQELRSSRSQLEDELGKPCPYLAYPYGENDERVREAARRAGYGAAFALRESFSRPDLFALPRVDLYRRDTRLRAWLKTSLLPRIPPRATKLVPRRKRDARNTDASRTSAEPEPEPAHPRDGEAPAADDF
jgi:peptidoglycan/xylan/chitin deacetylase (PgdA/CDA1 family)